MKLLIITQVMDTNHPILGFFHRWVEEFAKHCESVQVICLQEGKHSLPSNVTVHSLGKEKLETAGLALKRSEAMGKAGTGVSFTQTLSIKLRYIYRFYKLIWQLRHEYDSVFVHMNQIYVVLGAPFWRAFGKKIGLWYMHGTVTTSLKIAEKLTSKIFTGSTQSFRLPSDKVLITGHGIDVVRFSPQSSLKDVDLITVGRINSAKNLLEQIDILKDVRETNNVTLTIVGSVVTEVERVYQKELFEYINNNNLTEFVKFTGNVSQSQIPDLLNRAKVFVTTAQNGSLDKAMLEAMACGLPVVSSAEGSLSLPLGDNQVVSQEEFVTQVNKVLESSLRINDKNAEYVRNNHSIEVLVPKIIKIYE